jgi:hypothetical protein
MYNYAEGIKKSPCEMVQKSPEKREGNHHYGLN